jgi:hypothetical protein
VDHSSVFTAQQPSTSSGIFLSTAPPSLELDSSDDEDDPPFDDDDILSDDSGGEPPTKSEANVPVSGVVQAYLLQLKERLSREIELHKMPECYRQGHFWIRPSEPYFALRNALQSPDGLTPYSLYHPTVFVWLPNLLNHKVLTCQNQSCRHYCKTIKPLTVKCWNDNPIARRVVTLDGLYYVMTQRVHCDKRAGGCGKSMNLYDPIIMDQLDAGLAAAFPAFLTHRSGIDKTVMTLIRAGMAHRMSSSAWSDVIRELHVREHDLQELNYLHAISQAQKQEKARNAEGQKSYEPFSDFQDRDGYAGFYPSRWYINTVYMDYMEHIRPILDQCMAALTGYVIKWDNSFKLPKLLMKLGGEMTFAALFTLVNELEQIRFQAFVPTKSLSHIRAGLEEMVKSLEKHGLAQPILGFTDNVASDAATFMECIASLAKDVDAVQLQEFSDLPRATLPENVSIQVCSTPGEVQTACNSVLEITTHLPANEKLKLGYDQEWKYTTGQSGGGSEKTALVTLALPTVVYLLRVHNVHKLPSSLEVILNSPRILKIGRNVGGDLAKLSRDFSCSIPAKKKNGRESVIELGALAKSRNAVSNGNVSLAAITAATLQQHLSKDERSTDWNAHELSNEQMHYAALDGWIALQIYDVLHLQPSSGQSLKSASCINQAVSLYCRKQEVAKGVIVKQPKEFVIERISPTPMSTVVNVTPTRAVIRIDEVLVPDFILSFHKQTLCNVQAGRPSFEVLVSLSALKTRVEKVPASGTSAIQAPLMDDIPVIHPLESETAQSETILDDSDSESDGIPEADIFNGHNDKYSQPTASESHPSRILADVFHEINKVCRTISKKHSHHNKFATAFSDTMLVPDKNDRIKVEAYLKRAKLQPWSNFRLEKPKWVWKRVRRYIPEKNFLYTLLKEFFGCWGPVKCTVTGQPLFTEETWKKAQGVLHDVKKGWISDPAGIPLYTIACHDKHGLPIYHCIRGTNSVEGSVHNPIHRNFGALNASVELADCLVADFRHRHNVDVGMIHKSGTKHLGHYDPWIDHEITKMRADVNWTKKPVAGPTAQPETDPLAFPPTQEQFGITCIPGKVRLDCDFNGPVMMPVQDTSLSVSHIYPMKLYLSKLKGKRNDVYSYLSAAQQTKYAVTPMHTKEEFKQYNDTVSRGGVEWCPQAGKPNFQKMATWWSGKADGKHIFYKLPEHLSAYHKKWLERRNQSQSLVASEPQRQQHSERIHSIHHISNVLCPAPREHPGLMQHDEISERLQMITNDAELDQSVNMELAPEFQNEQSFPLTDLEQSVVAGPSQIITDTDTNPQLVHTLPPAAVVKFRAPILPTTPMLNYTPQHMINQAQMHSWSNLDLDSQEMTPASRGRRCAICVEAGRDGSICPGKTQRKYCRYGSKLLL